MWNRGTNFILIFVKQKIYRSVMKASSVFYIIFDKKLLVKETDGACGLHCQHKKHQKIEIF